MWCLLLSYFLFHSSHFHKAHWFPSLFLPGHLSLPRLGLPFWKGCGESPIFRGHNSSLLTTSSPQIPQAGRPVFSWPRVSWVSQHLTFPWVSPPLTHCLLKVSLEGPQPGTGQGSTITSPHQTHGFPFCLVLCWWTWLGDNGSPEAQGFSSCLWVKLPQMIFRGRERGFLWVSFF